MHLAPRLEPLFFFFSFSSSSEEKNNCETRICGAWRLDNALHVCRGLSKCQLGPRQMTLALVSLGNVEPRSSVSVRDRDDYNAAFQG